MDKSRIATEDDVRNSAAADCWTAPEPVTLPHSKLVVLLRRPTRLYHALRAEHWPEELREKIESAESQEALATALTQEETRFLLSDRPQLVRAAFVKPKVSVERLAGHCPFALFHEDDQQFILAYLRGQVFATGEHLDTFSEGQPGNARDGGEAREPIPGADTVRVSEAASLAVAD